MASQHIWERVIKYSQMLVCLACWTENKVWLLINDGHDRSGWLEPLDCIAIFLTDIARVFPSKLKFSKQYQLKNKFYLLRIIYVKSWLCFIIPLNILFLRKNWQKDRKGQCSHICKFGIPAKVPYLSDLYGIGHPQHYIYITVIAPAFCIIYNVVLLLINNTNNKKGLHPT